MRSIILLLVCLFSICLKAQTEFRVYQKESKKSWYYISAPINGTKLNDILITTGDAGFISRSMTSMNCFLTTLLQSPS